MSKYLEPPTYYQVAGGISGSQIGLHIGSIVRGIYFSPDPYRSALGTLKLADPDEAKGLAEQLTAIFNLAKESVRGDNARKDLMILDLLQMCAIQKMDTLDAWFSIDIKDIEFEELLRANEKSYLNHFDKTIKEVFQALIDFRHHNQPPQGKGYVGKSKVPRPE